MAPAVGFEPTTIRLTGERSTIELCWIKQLIKHGLGLCSIPCSIGYPAWTRTMNEASKEPSVTITPQGINTCEVCLGL